MTPDFTEMNISELRSYVLQHRSDRAAFYALMDRLNAKPPTTVYQKIGFKTPC